MTELKAILTNNESFDKNLIWIKANGMPKRVLLFSKINSLTL